MPEGITQHTLGLVSVQAILWLWATRPHLNRGLFLLRARTLCLGAANCTRPLLFGGQGERLCLCVRPGCSSRGECEGRLRHQPSLWYPHGGLIGAVCSTEESDSYLRAVPLNVSQDLDAGCGK